MKGRFFLFLISFSVLFYGCSSDNDTSVPRTLQEYIDANSGKELDNIVALAASASGSTTDTYIFYYPIDNATEISYYEAESTISDATDFSNYRRKTPTHTSVFGDKLNRFSRSSSEDGWCIVTFLAEGKLYKSDPIKLKIASKPTEWTTTATIEYPTTITPKFTWEDGSIVENTQYFQILFDEENDDGEAEFISGTFTTEKTFQFYDLTNTTSNINEGSTPADLVVDEEYYFIMMGVSEDNWVNLYIQKTFIPRNLEEYIAANTTKTSKEAIAFAASANNSLSLSYIYYYPPVGVTDMRFYETENTSVVETNFANYRRKSFTNTTVFGDKLRRFSRTSSIEVWGIVTFIIGDEFYVSKPIKIQNQSKPTEWLTEIDYDTSERLMPKFTWTDGSRAENETYFEAMVSISDEFLSGTFTNEKQFQYYNSANVISDINTETPPELVLSATYNFTVMGISEDNWLNLVIQTTFIAE